MPRGRKPILKDRKTTCVTIEGADLDFLKDQGKEVSEFLRESIAAFRNSKSSPIEQLKKDIELTKAKIQEYEIILNHQEKQLKELEEQDEIVKQEEQDKNEFEGKRREYVIGCIKSMRTQSTCNHLWLEYLRDAWKFPNFDEAKDYVKSVWIDEGVPEKKVMNYLRLN